MENVIQNSVVVCIVQHSYFLNFVQSAILNFLFFLVLMYYCLGLTTIGADVANIFKFCLQLCQMVFCFLLFHCVVYSSNWRLLYWFN